MCMVCTAIPTTVALGVALDARQRRSASYRPHASLRRRPYLLLTILAVVLLLYLSALIHTSLPQANS